MTPHFAALYRWLVISHQLDLPEQANCLLDVGTDDGFIARQVPARFRVGIDVVPAGVGAEGLSRVCASAERLPLPAAQFDCILAIDVLEHLSDDAAAVRDMLRALAADGTLWFSVPAREFRLIPAFVTERANRSFGHRRNGYLPADIKALTGDPDEWIVEFAFWNEPVFRVSFAFLHLVYLASPSLANWLVALCYAVDRHFVRGEHGHLVGWIRRRSAYSGGAREK